MGIEIRERASHETTESGTLLLGVCGFVRGSSREEVIYGTDQIRRQFVAGNEGKGKVWQGTTYWL